MMWSVASYARLDLRPIPLQEFMQFVLCPRPETLHGTPKAKLLFSKVHLGEGQCCLPLVAVNLQGQNSASRHFEAGIGIWVHEEVTTPRQNRCDSCHRQAWGGGGGGTQIANNMLCEGSHLCVSTDLNTPYTSSLGQPAPFWWFAEPSNMIG